MNNLILKNIVRFVILVFIQVIILNHVNLFGYLNPMIYILWVILFPIRKNTSYVLFFSFLLGLSVDFFSDSGGINAAAAVFIAYIRLPLLKGILRKSDFDYVLFNLRSIAFPKALFFISVLTIIHHFIVFSLEYFSFNEITTVLSKTFFTSILSIAISILGITIFTNKK